MPTLDIKILMAKMQHMNRTGLTPQILLAGYARGIFPMAESANDPEVFWVDPRQRGILPLDGFHISRSLARRMRNSGLTIAINADFAGVVAGCADRDETWINQEIFDQYSALFAIGHAHSLEVYRDRALVGGVYGVSLGGAFFGESMFSRETDASKIALAFLVDRLWRTGFSLCDVQFLTPHLASLGAIEIPREDYHQRLVDALERSADFANHSVAVPAAASVIQRITQTS